MFHYVYLITNTVNGKIYVGKHSTDDLDDGYMGSGKKLFEAKREFGIDKFERKILQMCDSEEEAFEFESLIVNEDFLSRDDVYNVVPGGMTSPITSSEFGKALWANHHYRQKVLNSHRDPEFIKRWREIMVKASWNNVNAIERQRIAVKKTMSHPDMKKKLSDIRKESWKNADHSRRENLARSTSITQAGHRNSQHGTLWISNERLETERKIKFEQLDEFLNEGWVKGRKFWRDKVRRTNDKNRSSPQLGTSVL